MESKGHIMENLQKLEIARWLEKIARLEKALRVYQHFNKINNDLQSYQYEMGLWAIGRLDKEPVPQDYGMEPI